MVLGDENLRAKIIERLKKRATSLDERQAAKARIERELEALALAESEGRDADTYQYLINIGTCFGVLNEPREALKYFKRAVEIYPEKRFPLWVVILTLSHLGEMVELEEYTRLYEERFPPRQPTK